jgi:hypothetical protein
MVRGLQPGTRIVTASEDKTAALLGREFRNDVDEGSAGRNLRALVASLRLGADFVVRPAACHRLPCNQSTSFNYAVTEEKSRSSRQIGIHCTRGPTLQQYSDKAHSDSSTTAGYTVTNVIKDMADNTERALQSRLSPASFSS